MLFLNTLQFTVYIWKNCKLIKNKLNQEESQLVSITNQLKMKSADEKYYNIDVMNTE